SAYQGPERGFPGRERGSMSGELNHQLHPGQQIGQRRGDVPRMLSVLATGQQPSRLQRRGRYTAESMRHPAKMLPAIASQVIEAFTHPGELVVDPMCGIGTTLVEAVHLGRRAAGMEYEPDFAHMAAANVLHAQAQGAIGKAQITIGDSAAIAEVYGS